MQAASVLLQSELPQTSTVNAVLSPQYSSQSSSIAISDNLPSPLSNESDLFPGVLQPSSLSAVPAHRHRRSSKTTMPAIVKRSASTPNVRGQAAADAAALSLAADKRRNKLGYHRTSVACGHCRRRKIRCLLATEDPTGRCLNCIRLKKECNFFPVDQQPQPDQSSRAGSKIDRAASGTGSSSPSASPGTQQGTIHEHDSFAGLPSAQVTPHQQDFAVPHSGRQHSVPVNAFGAGARLQAASHRPSLNHHQIAPVVTRGFDFNRDDRRASAWEGSPYDQSPISGEPKSALEDPSTNFWRLAESPMTPAFSSYGGPSPMTPMQHRESVGTFSFSGTREDLGWPVPASRSMSVGHFESYPRDYSSHYAIQNEFKPPQPTNIYPPSLNTSGISMASGSEPQSAGPDSQAPPLASNAFGTQSGWNPSFIANTMNGMAAKGADAFGGWYTDSGHLAQVEEEDPGVHFHEEPPIIYQHGAQSAA